MRISDLLLEVKVRPHGESLPVLTLTEKQGFVLQSERFNKRLATEDTSGYKVVRLDEFAFNPYLLWAGAIARNTVCDGVTSPLYPTFRVRQGFDPSYVGWLLHSPPTIQMYDQIAFGSVPRRRRSSVADFLRLPLPDLPPLPEQRRIAAILDEADALASRAAAEEASASEYADSSFSTVFGQTTVHQTTLGLVANVTSGITKGRKLNGQATREVPYLAVSNVQAGFLDMRVVKTIDATEDEIARLRLRDGDLLLTEGGDPDKLGRGTLWRDELPLCLHQNHVFRVRLPEDSPLTPGFLAGYLRSSEARTYFLRSAKQTTGIASINMTQLKALPVPLPEKDEQERYLNSLKAIGPMQAQMTRRSTLLTELFASLQSRAFSGQL